MRLKKIIQELQHSPVGKKVQQRLAEFSSFSHKDGDAWFSELCFCILTANARAQTAINIQNEIGSHGFLTLPQKNLTAAIRKNKHRFHNTKARFIVKARGHSAVKSSILPIISQHGIPAARDWLVAGVKGIGYKEASHFLRNVGYFELAILDRHILNVMHEHELIQRPKALSRKYYFQIEKKFQELAAQLGMSPGELDCYMWHMKTGSVLK